MLIPGVLAICPVHMPKVDIFWCFVPILQSLLYQIKAYSATEEDIYDHVLRMLVQTDFMSSFSGSYITSASSSEMRKSVRNTTYIHTAAWTIFCTLPVRVASFFPLRNWNLCLMWCIFSVLGQDRVRCKRPGSWSEILEVLTHFDWNISSLFLSLF